MSTDFATAMRRALESTRAQNPSEATAIIQAALAGDHADRERRSQEDAGSPRARFGVIDPAADEAEIADGGPQPEKEARPPEPPPTTRRLFGAVQSAANPSTGGDAGRRIRPNGRGGRLRRSLREVVDGLSRGRPGMAVDLAGLKRASAPPDIPEGARYEFRSFSSAVGARDYRLYIPSSARPQGLLLMLHGCTQDPDDFANGTAMNAHAERHGLLVAYPAQTAAHNASSCWNWFRPGDQRRDAGEPAILAGMTQALVAEFGVEPPQVYVAGLSAGGAMAAVMGEIYPDLYAAVGIHSGLPHGSASDVVSAFAAMRGEASGIPPVSHVAAGSRSVRTIVFHGSADATVHPSNADRIVAAAKARAEGGAAQSETDASPGGHRYRRTVATGPDGTVLTELWLVDGLGHAWSGGAPAGSYTDPAGPDASAEMIRFFLHLS